MFTGIIKATSPVLRCVPRSGKHEVVISIPQAFGRLYEGQSIACDGICLTVNSFDSQSFAVEVMQETWQKTTASTWKANTVLNLEPALRIGDNLDGHWVQGHIDRTLKLLEHKIIGSTTYLRFELPEQDKQLLVRQGSIALNGVSLTVAELASSSFNVALITHTLQHSNLNLLRPGSSVNAEYDVLGKYVLRSLEAGGTNLMDLLR